MLLHNFFYGASWAVVAAELTIGLISLIIYRRYFTSIGDVPGPFLATFTRLWHIKHIAIGDFNIRLAKLHEEHGHFVRIAPNEVSVSHPDAIKQILLASLAKAPWYKVMAMPDYRFQNPFSILNPTAKKEHSKKFASAYTTTNVLQSEGDMDHLIEMLKGWMDKYAEQKKPMNLGQYISYTTFDIAGQMIFSKPFGFLSAGLDIANTISNAIPLNLYVAVAGYFYWLHSALIGNPVITRTGVLPMGHLYNTTLKAVTERQNNVDAGFDMAAHWFKTQREHPGQVDFRDVLAHTIISVGGATDTVSIALQSFIYHMIRHPTAYQRLRDEIDASRVEGRCKSPIVQFADAQKLDYLHACIKESLRIFGPFGSLLPRVAGKAGVTIGGRTFPESTILSVSPWVIHRSKDFWGPDAEEFNPDRWLAQGCAAQEKYLVPFSAGYAACPGQNMAKIELSKMAATLVRDYNIRQVDEGQKWDWLARIVISIKEQSWPVYIEKRIE